MQRSIAINGSDDVSFGESSRLSHIRPIADGASGCVNVARVKRCIVSICPLDPHRAVAMN